MSEKKKAENVDSKKEVLVIVLCILLYFAFLSF